MSGHNSASDPGQTHKVAKGDEDKDEDKKKKKDKDGDKDDDKDDKKNTNKQTQEQLQAALSPAHVMRTIDEWRNRGLEPGDAVIGVEAEASLRSRVAARACARLISGRMAPGGARGGNTRMGLGRAIKKY